MSAVTPYPAPTAGSAEPTLVTVGDIRVTRSWVVTPRGIVPTAGSEWWVVDRVAWTQQIPVWAIILAVLLFPIGLLFLLVKENRMTGWIEVTVRSGGLVHATFVAAQSYEAIELRGKVEYARALAMSDG